MADRDDHDLYDSDEVEAILARALSHSKKRDGLSADDLRDVAREVGIDAATLDDAIVEVREDRIVEDERTRITTRRRSGFGVHFFVYAVVNVALTLLARRLGLVSMLAWGIGLFFHALSALPVARLDRARVLRRVAKRTQRRERDRRARELGDAATAGLAEVLRAATDALEGRRIGGRTRSSRSRERYEGGVGDMRPPRVRVAGEHAEAAAPRSDARHHAEDAEDAEDAEIVDPTPHDRHRRRR